MSAPAAASGDSTVTPPAATSEAVAAGGTPSAKTFGSFTDADSIISSYASTVRSAVGSTSASGSGLGAYTYSSHSNGNSYVHYLDGRDAAGNILATAVHAVDIAAAGGVQSLLDWSGTSHNWLTAGEGSHTVGGKTVVLDYSTGSAPSTLSMTSGVITFVGDNTHRGYLIIDLGEDLDDGAWIAYMSIDGATNSESTVTAIMKISSNQTVGNAANQYQTLIGNGGTNTALLEREANGASSFTTANNRTVTDITTTPTLLGCQVMGGAMLSCYSQGSATLPTDGQLFGTIGPKSYHDGGSAQTTQNRRYLYVAMHQNCTVRVSAYRLSEA
jgi:hypothetical protein